MVLVNGVLSGVEQMLRGLLIVVLSVLLSRIVSLVIIVRLMWIEIVRNGLFMFVKVLYLNGSGIDSIRYCCVLYMNEWLLRQLSLCFWYMMMMFGLYSIGMCGVGWVIWMKCMLLSVVSVLFLFGVRCVCSLIMWCCRCLFVLVKRGWKFIGMVLFGKRIWFVMQYFGCILMVVCG